jgi:hypothetical protein
MIHAETHTITKDNGPRPAGKPNECFYCHRKIGQQHANDCPCRHRTIVVEARIRYVTVTSEYVTPESFNARHDCSDGAGTWCGDNVFKDMERCGLNSDAPEGEPCACDSVKVLYIREASPEDEERYHVAEFFKDA